MPSGNGYPSQQVSNERYEGGDMATDIDALRLNVRYDEGSGPVMVLLHGINSDATDWRVVIDTIGSGYRFIAVDLLGFGESPRPLDIDYTADEHATVIHNTLRDLGVDRPFLLVGYSLGGDIAIRYAATWPAQVRRLFLLSTPFYLPPDTFSAKGFGTQYLQVIAFQRIWKFVARSKKRDNLLYQIVDGRAQDFAKQFLRTDDVATSWEVMSKNLRNCIARATFVNDLPRLDMPVTFALGIRDPIVHPDQTPALKVLMPEMDIRRIVGLSADHFMLLNLPETVAREIVRDEVNGLHVRYRAQPDTAAGTDLPVPAVFLHGVVEAPSFWIPVARGLSTIREVECIDLLGCGESPTPLSSRYGLEDHVDAVVRTLKRDFGDRPVQLIGHGFGATAALGVARAEPDRVAGVTAFSPLIVDPERSESGSRSAAEVLAIRDRARAMATDPRMRVAAEHAETTLIPLVRTIDNGVLGTDPATVMAEQRRPVTFVVPTEDAATPVGYLERLATCTDEARLLRPDGSRWLPIDNPAATVLLLAPEAQDGARIAAETPAPRRELFLETARETFASASNQVMWRGLVMMALGIVLLFVQHVPPTLLTIGAAIWVLVEGVTTIAGSFGLRRSGKNGWLPWLLIGGLSILVGLFLLLRRDVSVRIIALVIAARALYIGVANLYIVRRVGALPKARWLLVFEGMLGLMIGVFLLVDPSLGARMLKVVLEWYLIGAGFSAVAYAVANRRAIKKRVDAVLVARTEGAAS